MFVLAPYRWIPAEESPVGGHWAGHGPGVDLRRRSEMAARGGVTGYGIFEVADDANIDGMVTFTGNATRDLDAWESTLGVRPAGSTPEEMLWSHLIDGDDTGADRARPLRAINADDLELHFGGRKTRKLTAAQKLQQAVSIRRDLDKIFDDVEAGRLPNGSHRRMLAMEARKLGIDPRTLKSKSARWRNEDAEEPHTLLCSTFQDLARFTAVNGTWGVSGSLLSMSAPNTTICYIKHNGTMSSANHEVRFASQTRNLTDGQFGPICRVSADSSAAAIDCYAMLSYQANSDTYKVVNNTISQFSPSTEYSLAGDLPRRLEATGSTVRSSDTFASWRATFTDTTITGNVLVGVMGYRQSASSTVYISGFRAFDGGSLAPTVTAVSPSTGPTAGGTAIELTGTNFDTDGTVTVVGNSATSVVIFDDTKATAVTPAGSGTGDVGMTTGGGGFYGAKINGFTYTATAVVSYDPENEDEEQER